MDNQHLVKVASNQRQVCELISGPSLVANTSLLCFSRTQSRLVIGLPPGHHILRRHLHLMGLTNNLYVGGVEQRMNLQPTFPVSMKLWLQMCIIWAPLSWTQRI